MLPMTAQERIAALSTTTWTLAALAASVESGLVAALDEPRDVGDLAARTGLPVTVAAALIDVLASLELAERIGEHWVAGAELEPVVRDPVLGLLRDDLRTTLLQSSDLVAKARHQPHALGGWVTPTRTCFRRRAACRRASFPCSRGCSSRTCRACSTA